ncbi:MAG: UDP-N-acetylmuramoyl-L-alanine--D-glutamate ligase [Anaerolineae bacterium]|nr:UDP-N-acetylmuramoyl-L-alanine--D-glutamate ligase [Anaerolineae bacterium]
MKQQDPLHGKRILIIGFGRQGKALARWLPKVGARVVVNDKRTAEELKLNRSDYPDVQFVLGRHPSSVLRGTDLICISGGVSLQLPLLRAAKKRKIPITNDAQLFLERCPAPVIGITGSAGKTTTTMLVGEIIQCAGYKTWVGGNVGDVLLDVLDDIVPDDVVVMELSSFQLELMTCSPQVAAVLNITPNHLDRHKTMEAYAAAKANILRYQTENNIAVLSVDDLIANALEVMVQGELVTFSARTMVANGAFCVGNRVVLAGAASFDYVPHILLQKDDIPLRGDHNVLNVLAACAIAGSLGLAADRPGIDPDTMREAILNFRPVPHRLEVVREVEGVVYINDSIATAPERLVAALRSFSEPLVLLLGGADKDLPWDEAVHLALQKSKHIILFGEEGEKQVRDKAMRLLRLLGASDKIMTLVGTLDDAVATAAEIATAGDIVLLSPGGTSYDAYHDFAERGEHFRKLVDAL